MTAPPIETKHKNTAVLGDIAQEKGPDSDLCGLLSGLFLNFYSYGVSVLTSMLHLLISFRNLMSGISAILKYQRNCRPP